MEALNTLTERYFIELHATSLDALLAPLVGTSEAGIALSDSAVYSAIRNAREQEDASLPLGAWERELKQADWPKVSQLCLDALRTQSKDIQIAAWLLEAEIHNRGFAALGPCLNLLGMLSKTYWPTLYPLDPEHRGNIYFWLSDKLRLPLRLQPFTATGSGREFGWADWEQAQRNEQIRATLGKDAEPMIEGATLNLFGAALASTPSTNILAVQDQLAAGHAGLATLNAVLKPLLGEEAPNFEPLRDLLENIELMLAAEARKRGLARKNIEAPIAPVAEATEQPEGTIPPLGELERTQLYHSLSLVADQLAQIEPHSPVPYLIRRAVSWGSLNTAQLYSEVFVRCGGQINIFELLGLEDQTTDNAEHAAS